MSNKGFWLTITSKFFLLAALVALLAVAYGVGKSAIRRAEIEREIAALKAEISEHQSKSEQLSQLIDYLGTEEYKEREARLQFGLQKPGETVVIIPSEDAVNQTAGDEGSSSQANWQRWLNYFLGLK